MYDTKGRKYQQVQSLRDLSGTSFPNGQIRFNFTVPAGESWNPYLSFFTIRNNVQSVTLSNGNTLAAGLFSGQLGVAPSMFFNDGLFQTLDMRINGVSIDKQDNYCHQIAALKWRMKPEDQNKSIDIINFTEEDVDDRAARLLQGKPGHTFNKPIKSGAIDIFDLRTADAPTVAWQNKGAGVANTITFTDVDLTRIAPADSENIYPLSLNIGNSTGAALETKATGVIATALTITMTSEFAHGAQGAVAFQRGQIILNAVDPISPVIERDRAGFNKFETIWKPKLGCWELDAWLPGGNYELILTPYVEGQYQINTWECHNTIVTKVNYIIDNMLLNICTSSTLSQIKSIEFIETKCQAKTINTSSLSQKQFNISPKTKCLTIAYQDNRVSNRLDLPSSKFKMVNNNNKDYELQLNRFYIQYDGQVLPNPIPAIQTTKDIDYTVQRYWETQKYKLMTYYEMETLDEWKRRGAYYHFCWPRTDHGASEIQVSQEFNGSFEDSLRPQLLLFEHYACKWDFQLNNGFITGLKQVH